MRIILFLAICVLGSCGSGGSSAIANELDLMKHGMPIKIKAPADAIVTASDLGVMKDITVKSTDNYFIQITSGIATTTDLVDLKTKKLEEVKRSAFFDALISEDDHGFVYRKKIDDRVNHDFRYYKIQGDQEYLFQTGLMGKFTQEDVQRMYDSVQ